MYKLNSPVSFGSISQPSPSVNKLNEDGSQTSFLLGTDSPEEQAYLAWLADGNIPLPADEVTQ